jgi:hypothetical protein
MIPPGAVKRRFELLPEIKSIINRAPAMSRRIPQLRRPVLASREVIARAEEFAGCEGQNRVVVFFPQP